MTRTRKVGKKGLRGGGSTSCCVRLHPGAFRSASAKKGGRKTRKGGRKTRKGGRDPCGGAANALRCARPCMWYSGRPPRGSGCTADCCKKLMRQKGGRKTRQVKKMRKKKTRRKK